MVYHTCRQNTYNKAIKTNKNAQKQWCKDSVMLRLKTGILHHSLIYQGINAFKCLFIKW